MNKVLLTDFSKRELQALLNSVISTIYLVKLNEFGNFTQKEIDNTVEDLTLWKVQILNAVAVVGLREEISSN